MAKPILFVLGQSASVSYLAPVWRTWPSDAPGWFVLGTSHAVDRMRLEGFDVDSRCLSSSSKKAWEDLLPGLLVVSASGSQIEREAISLARQNGIKVVAILDTWYGLIRRCRSDNFDLVLVIDEVCRQTLVEHGLDSSMVSVVGHPGWETVAPLASVNPHVVMYVSQPVRHFYGSSLGYDEWSAFELLRDASRRRPDLIQEIIFAPHPGDHMPPPDGHKTVAGREGLAVAGTVVGLFSSLLVDASIAGKNVILLHPGRGAAVISPFGPHYCSGAGDVNCLIQRMEHPAKIGIDYEQILRGSCERVCALWGDLV